MRIFTAQLNPIIADIKGNASKIIEKIRQARKEKYAIILFPELILTGYPPEDFLLLPHFIEAVEAALNEIARETKDITAIVGTARRNFNKNEKPLFNSAAILQNGEILGYQDKTLLPTYDVFDERRYFEPTHDCKVWAIEGKRLAITICEDIWHGAVYTKDPVVELKKQPIDVMLNLSASPFHVGKFFDRLHVCSRAAKELQCPVILCNQVGGNDSLIFDGHSLYVSKNGELLAMAKGFQEDDFVIDLEEAKEPISYKPQAIEELHDALILGLRDYFHKSGFKKACLGLSGGIDSALVAYLAKEALGSDNVLGIAMPSRYSSEGSITDAVELAHNLGIRYRHIPIEDPFKAYLELLTPYFEDKQPDVTEENLQARIRGMILMAISNKLGYIVLSTGNKSELAMGYSTLYGDMCGGLGVISDVTKGQVYALSKWINRDREIIPKNSIEKPPSAELRPNQKDSDSLPDYDIVDTVLKEYLENNQEAEEIYAKYNYPKDLVDSLIARIHNNEYKRRQSPPGLRVSEKAFSVGRRFPIVQGWVSCK